MAFLGLAWHHLGLSFDGFLGPSLAFILMAFLGLAWRHLGLYVEISRLEISS